MYRSYSSPVVLWYTSSPCRLPLRAVARFFSLIGEPENAEIIRKEIASINGLYGAFGNKIPKIPEVPCPFSHSLLSFAWSTDLSDPSEVYIIPSLPLPASMGTSQGGVCTIFYFF